MNIKSLLFAPVCALLAVSAASASNVLFTENWSGFDVGSNIFAQGSGWKYYGTAEREDRLVIANIGDNENPKKVLSSVFQTGDSFLPYAAVAQSFSLDKGLSLDVTFERRAPTANYLRLAFMPSNETAPSNSNIYVVDFEANAFKVARGGTTLSGGSIAYTSVNALSPVNNFREFSFQIASSEEGILLRVLYAGSEIWSIVDSSEAKLDFTSGVTAMIGIRSGVNYISDVQVTAIPEPSHFAIGAGVAALLAASFLRRRSRRA